MTSYEGLVDDKVALDQLLFFGMLDEFAAGGRSLLQMHVGAQATPIGAPIGRSRFTKGVLETDANSLYFLEDDAIKLTLYRATRMGENPQSLGTYTGAMIGSGPDGVVVWELTPIDTDAY